MTGTERSPGRTCRGHDEPFVIGLTGPIASGKSTVAQMLQDYGVETIDADLVYRALLSPGSSLTRAIGDRFGPQVVLPSGEIDRARLGKIVFGDLEALADLDRITHPPVVHAIRQRLAASSARVVAVEAIKLVQAGLLPDVDALWYVTADPEVRLERLMERGNLSHDAARARIVAAPSVLPVGVVADLTIDTTGDLAATRQAVTSAWSALGFGHDARRPAWSGSTRGTP
jgi:dephospho-CoA kinase